MMKNIWLPLVLVVIVVVGYFLLKGQGQLVNNTIPANTATNSTDQTNNTGSIVAPDGSVDTTVQAILQAAANDQSVSANDTGEAALANNINQQIGNINQPYENQF